MRESLKIAETPKDVNSSKQLIQEHEEKWEDIQTHNDRLSVYRGLCSSASVDCITAPMNM